MEGNQSHTSQAAAQSRIGRRRKEPSYQVRASALGGTGSLYFFSPISAFSSS